MICSCVFFFCYQKLQNYFLLRKVCFCAGILHVGSLDLLLLVMHSSLGVVLHSECFRWNRADGVSGGGVSVVVALDTSCLAQGGSPDQRKASHEARERAESVASAVTLVCVFLFDLNENTSNPSTVRR